MYFSSFFAGANSLRLAGTSAAILLVSACATPVYTVDDGSPVDENLLSEIRLFGKGHQALRPGIIKTAALADKDCDNQWELPFAVATSYDLPKAKKIAWARGLGVDERLSVIAATSDSNLSVGEKIEEINGYKRENTEKMYAELMDYRDSGRPFELKIAGGKAVKVTPVKVCRGHAMVTQPESEVAQEYHWLQSMHPLNIFTEPLSSDEALWAVLWTQGLSEEAGARMKSYHYGLKLVKTGIVVASIASGIGAVTSAANAAAASAATTAGNVASQAAIKAAANAVTQQVAGSMRQKMIETAQKVITQQAQGIAINSIAAATLFKESLTGVSWVAGTGFYMADKWAFDRMEALGADPVAAFTLHYKLASNALAQNAFVFDEERLKLISEFAQNKGIGDKVALALAGEDPNAPPAVAMPVADTGAIEVHSLDDTSQVMMAKMEEVDSTLLTPIKDVAEIAGAVVTTTQGQLP